MDANIENTSKFPSASESTSRVKRPTSADIIKGSDDGPKQVGRTFSQICWKPTAPGTITCGINMWSGNLKELSARAAGKTSELSEREGQFNESDDLMKILGLDKTKEAIKDDTPPQKGSENSGDDDFGSIADGNESDNGASDSTSKDSSGSESESPQNTSQTLMATCKDFPSSRKTLSQAPNKYQINTYHREHSSSSEEESEAKEREKQMEPTSPTFKYTDTSQSEGVNDDGSSNSASKKSSKGKSSNSASEDSSGSKSESPKCSSGKNAFLRSPDSSSKAKAKEIYLKGKPLQESNRI